MNAQQIDPATLLVSIQRLETEAARLRSEILQHVQNEARYALRIKELEEQLEKAVWERDNYQCDKYHPADDIKRSPANG